MTLLGLPGAVTPARADDAEKGAAQALFEQGRALIQEKRFAEACPKFAESLRLAPGIGTMLFLADCYENSGKTASAWAEFKDAAAAAALKQDPREAIAKRRADDLEPKLSRLVLVSPAEGSVPGLEVRRDGVVIGAAELGIPVPVNPGVHVISATAAGHKEWSTSVTVTDKPGAVSVVIPVLETAPDEPKVAAGPGVTAGGAETPPEKRTWGTRQTVGVAAGGAGILFIAVGSAFGIAAKSTYDTWQSACTSGPKSNSDCTPSERNAASTQADVADVMFGVGLAAIVGGALLYFTTPRSQAPPSSGSALTITPVASPWGGGMLLSRVW
jgi:hypothetical protein